jgi:DNA-binding Lrp family transcriptional regulator
MRTPFSPQTEPRELDEQERKILRALIRDPRQSDNAIGETTGVNVRTVSRKRHRLEEEGILSYYANVDLTASGTGQYATRHLYTIKFRIGITFKQLVEDIQREPAVRSVFTEVLFESHIAGENDLDIVQTVQEKLVPSLRRNHGEDSIEEVSTMRILSPVRQMRNYVLPVNMHKGFIRADWPEEAIYVGR